MKWDHGSWGQMVDIEDQKEIVMKLLKSVVAVTFSLVLLVGCGVKEHNAQIAQSNNSYMVSVGEAMAKQTTEGGRMAVLALSYMGRQNLQHYDTAKDYMTVGIPLLNTIFRGADMLGWGSGSNSDGEMNAGNNIYYKSTFGDKSAWDKVSFMPDYSVKEGTDGEELQTADNELQQGDAD